MKYLIFLFPLLFLPAQACEIHGAQPYVRAAAGWTGRFDGQDDFWEGTDELAAQLELGIRFPLTQSWVVDAKVSHDSHWFISEESSIEHINFGLEYRW